MSKVEQMETEMRKLSPVELQPLRGWLEDRLEITEEFATSIERRKKDNAEGNVRVREPNRHGCQASAPARIAD